MAKQPATFNGIRKLKPKADGHTFNKPTLLDADHDREVTARNDAALVGYQAAAGIEEIKTESVTPDKTVDVKAKEA